MWSSGNYNGAIKTRKTTQPAEVKAEEAASERSQQLMELYETLFAGESSMEARACTALSPEDLTDPEWFYVLCFTYSFEPPSGYNSSLSVFKVFFSFQKDSTQSFLICPFHLLLEKTKIVLCVKCESQILRKH